MGGITVPVKIARELWKDNPEVLRDLNGEEHVVCAANFDDDDGLCLVPIEYGGSTWGMSASRGEDDAVTVAVIAGIKGE